MKRQVSGSRRVHNDEVDHSSSNERKRLKLLQNSCEIPANSDNQNLGMNISVDLNTPNGSGENEFLFTDSFLPQFANGSHSESFTNGTSINSEEVHAQLISESSPNVNEKVLSTSPANLKDETISVPFEIEVNNSLPPNLVPEISHYPTDIHSQDNTYHPISSEIEKGNEPHPHDVLNVTSEKIVTNSDKKEDCSVTSQDNGSEQKFMKSDTIKLNNLSRCQLKMAQLKGHAGQITCIDSYENIVLSASVDTTIKVWDVAEEKEVCNFAGHTGSVTSVILLSPEHSKKLAEKLPNLESPRLVASASMDSHVRLWSLDGQEISSIYTYNSITCMSCLQNPAYVIIGTEGGKLEVWNLLTAKLINSVYAHEMAVSSIKVNDDYVYSVSGDGAVKVFLFEDEELQPLYTRKRKQVSNVSEFSPAQWKSVTEHKDFLYLGDYTSYLKVLNWRLGQQKIIVNQVGAKGMCSAVLAKDDILLSSFYDFSSNTGGLNVWHLPHMEYIGSLTGDVQEISSLSLTQFENHLRIITGGAELIVWDFDLSLPLKESPDPKFFVHTIKNLGSLVEEKALDSPRLETQGPASNDSQSKSWCNIS